MGQRPAFHGRTSDRGRFEAELYALTKEEGGRHTPFFSNYRPQFFFRTADVTGMTSRIFFSLSPTLHLRPAHAFTPASKLW